MRHLITFLISLPLLTACSMVDEEDYYSYNHYHNAPRTEVHPGYGSQGQHHQHGGKASTGGNQYHGTINSQPGSSQPVHGHNSEVRPAVEPLVDIVDHAEVHGH